MNLLEIFFPKKASNTKLEDLIFFTVETDDSFNSQVVGQTQEYCWDEVCEFPPIKGFYYILFYFFLFN